MTPAPPRHVRGRQRGTGGDRSTGLSAAARRAAQARDWASVDTCAREILKSDRRSAEGWFLAGLAGKGTGTLNKAVESFNRALNLDAARYDAAVELAHVYWAQARNREAKDLLDRYESKLTNSPLYLDMAAETWSRLGLHARARPLYRKALELQPGIERFEAGLARNAVFLGRIDEARTLYRGLLERYPRHQRHHYELSRLERARDRSHVDQMKSVLAATKGPPERNIFLYYAIAKELEDLEDWDESFRYYRLGGDAAAGQAAKAGYDVTHDIQLIDRIIEVCSPEWLAAASTQPDPDPPDRGSGQPLFIVGLPRTGTTLTERIIASHSRVESADETFFLQDAIRQSSRVRSRDDMSPRIIEAAAREDMARIARLYLEAVEYRLGGSPIFIDKYPLNYLYLGFISRVFPQSSVVHLRRHPMDACFAMYKQSFFRFAYTLEDVAEYYLAYERLSRHWRAHLGHRIVEVEYESLVADPEARIRGLLASLDLEFEQACLDFHLIETPSGTASAAQIRERPHTRSVGRWRKFERHLQPLRKRLEAAGIEVE
jgi:tetratricopeptide (TPR) repeat protein